MLWLPSVYLLNRFPTRTLNWRSPFEEMWNRKPKYDHLQVLGSVGFARKNKARFGKIEKRAEKVVLLGYATNLKEYLVKEFNTNRAMKMRTARFNEEVKYRTPTTKNYQKEMSLDKLK